MSDLGEEFAKICIQWLKKGMTCICILTAWLGKLLTVRKKKKKKKKKNPDPTDPIFYFGRVRAT